MIVTLIVVCEVGFWVLLAGGLSLRYLARMPRAGIAVLLMEPVLELVLLIATAVDLRNGATADWKHGLAAVYLGFSVGLGHSTIKWADQRFAHRFAGGPPPVKPPKYGTARTVHEWKTAGKWVLAAAVAMGLLQAAIMYIGGSGDVSSLRMWQSKMLWVIGINVVIALSYTIWPKQPKPEAARKTEQETTEQPLTRR
ncbi:hypothetical protein [Streptomyces cinnamoneus]|uniref:Uncharacterized protein n=1 Tax=Streptomyces cinnamoneus TaxID=53446 RepID=A0A918THY7_STRCJ|nr:hypothetical protein [Streptomyces cinnamoneus]GHC48507.1 hypothetical protein GCM10010507_25050 [Streptomyces cinnamoneus]